MVYIPRTSTVREEEFGETPEQDDNIVNRRDRKKFHCASLRPSSGRLFLRWFVMGAIVALIVFGAAAAGIWKLFFSFLSTS